MNICDVCVCILSVNERGVVGANLGGKLGLSTVERVLNDGVADGDADSCADVTDEGEGGGGDTNVARLDGGVDYEMYLVL